MDTNVLSETVKPVPNETVLLWLRQQPNDELFTTSVTQAEICHGVWRMPHGKRRDALALAVDAMFDEDFEKRVLPFDGAAAPLYAEITVKRELLGREIADFDAQIAAIARYHSATLVTRNTKDFGDCGVTLLNPWDEIITEPSVPARTASSG